MNLSPEFYSQLATISWLANTGRYLRPTFGFAVTYAETRSAALNAFDSTLWLDVKTEAKGDLTGYLARHYYRHLP